MDKNTKVHIYLLFLVWPLISLVYVFKNYRQPLARIVFVLVISFAGFTAESEGDLQRYEKSFYANKEKSIAIILQNYSSLSQADIYTDTVSLLTGLIFNSHHYYFAFLFGIYAYLLSGVIIWFLKLLPEKLNTSTLLLFIGFALFYSLRSIISVRFYTGGLFYLLMILNFISTREMKYMAFSFLTPLFHFGLGLVILVGPLFLILRNRYLPTLAIVILSFTIGQTNVTNTIGQISSKNMDTVFAKKYKTYGSVEGIERLNKRYRDGSVFFNWKLKALNNIKVVLLYFVLLGIGILFYFRKKITINSIYADLFILVLLLLSASNIMNNVSNGVRYFFIHTFMALGLFTLLHANSFVSKLFKSYLIILIPLSLIYGLMSLYAANPLFTYMFYIFNYPVAIFLGK